MEKEYQLIFIIFKIMFPNERSNNNNPTDKTVIFCSQGMIIFKGFFTGDLFWKISEFWNYKH